MIDRERLRDESQQRLSDLPPETRLRLKGLTPCESEVALLAARGCTEKGIARERQVTGGTVKALLSRGRVKLGCRNSRDLLVVMLLTGVLSVDQPVWRSPRCR